MAQNFMVISAGTGEIITIRTAQPPFLQEDCQKCGALNMTMQLPSSDFKALSNGTCTSKIGPVADEILPIWLLIW